MIPQARGCGAPKAGAALKMAIELSNADRNGTTFFRTDLGKQRQVGPMRAYYAAETTGWDSTLVDGLEVQ